MLGLVRPSVLGEVVYHRSDKAEKDSCQRPDEFLGICKTAVYKPHLVDDPCGAGQQNDWYEPCHNLFRSYAQLAIYHVVHQYLAVKYGHIALQIFGFFDGGRLVEPISGFAGIAEHLTGYG